MAIKKVSNTKTRPKSKATAKATAVAKPLETNPWKLVVLEMFHTMDEDSVDVDEDFCESIYDDIHNKCGISPAQLDKMIKEYRETKQEAVRFKKILALDVMKKAWKSLPGDQQELLRDLSAHEFVEQVTE